MTAVRRLALLCSAIVLTLPSFAQSGKIGVQAVTQVSPTRPQYTKVDVPLLRDGIARAAGGRFEVTPASCPERNVNGREVLRLLRSGQVDIVAAPLTTVSDDVPILDGLDLSGMNPAQPVSVASGEVYTALERGTVDCAPSPARVRAMA